MTRMRSMRSLMIFLLSGLPILGPGILWAAQQEEPIPVTMREQKQLPPTPGEGAQIYLPGAKPFLWEHHGADPYYLVPERNALVDLSEKPGLTSDLAEQGFTQAEAEYLQRALANAKSPDSVVTEVTLPVDTPFQRMRFGHGVKAMVILKGKAEEAWQIVLPPQIGSRVIWLPKVCGNICLSPLPARTETFVIKTEVKERERIIRVEKPPVYIPKPVYRPVDRPVFIERPVYQESGSRCGKKCKITLGVLAGGIVTGVYFGTRHQAVVPYKPPGGGGGVN